jgi:hypothetical protein
MYAYVLSLFVGVTFFTHFEEATEALRWLLEQIDIVYKYSKEEEEGKMYIKVFQYLLFYFVNICPCW